MTTDHDHRWRRWRCAPIGDSSTTLGYVVRVRSTSYDYQEVAVMLVEGADGRLRGSLTQDTNTEPVDYVSTIAFAGHVFGQRVRLTAADNDGWEK